MRQLAARQAAPSLPLATPSDAPRFLALFSLD